MYYYWSNDGWINSFDKFIKSRSESVIFIFIFIFILFLVSNQIEQFFSFHSFDELGYFAFGGSTVVCLFEKGMVVFDADLQKNEARQLETLVQVGNAIGRKAN